VKKNQDFVLYTLRFFVLTFPSASRLTMESYTPTFYFRWDRIAKKAQGIIKKMQYFIFE